MSTTRINKILATDTICETADWHLLKPTGGSSWRVEYSSWKNTSDGSGLIKITALLKGEMRPQVTVCSTFTDEESYGIALLSCQLRLNAGIRSYVNIMFNLKEDYGT